MMAKEPKKIYINGRFLTQSITGVQRYAHELVKAWDYLIDIGEIDRSNYNFTLITPKKGIIYDLELKHISIKQVGQLTGHAWEQIDLPLNCKDGLLFCPGNTAPLISLCSRQKVVVTVHDLSYLYFPDAYSVRFKAVYNLLIPQIFKRANAVITVSKSEKKAILSRYEYVKERIYAIQNGGLSKKYLEEAFSEQNFKTENNAEQFYMLYVGSLSRRKNFHGILKAISILNQKENIPLVVAGAAGKAFDNTDFDVSGNVVEKVDFKGQINDINKLIQLYKNAVGLIFPSFYEASPLPPIEAMASGCPVISSTIPSLQERCGDVALYCDPSDPNDIAVKIKQLINDEELRDKLKQKGLERSSQFTWEKCAHKSFDVIKEVLYKSEER